MPNHFHLVLETPGGNLVAGEARGCLQRICAYGVQKSMARTASEKSWVRQVLKQYDEIEKLQPKSINATVNALPEWVVKLWLTLFAVSHPGLKIKRHKNWTAKDLGQFLGRQCALEGVVWDEVPLSPRVQ